MSQYGEPGFAPQPHGPADEQALTEGIEHTRAQLAATIEEIVAKANVKRQARVAARKLTGRLQARAGDVGAQAAHRGYQVRGHVTRAAGQAGQAGSRLPRQAGAAARTAVSQARSVLPGAGHTVPQQRSGATSVAASSGQSRQFASR